MVVDFLFLAVSAIFLLMVALLIFKRGYHGWIYIGFSAFFTILLVLLLLFAWFEPGSNSIELKITNYSSEKGNLYFYTAPGCNVPVWYDFPVSNNEERYLEIEGLVNQVRQIIFVTANDNLYTVPVPAGGGAELNIWKKEMEPADDCFISQIENYQLRQKKFSVVIGLSLFSLLILFVYRWIRKQEATIPGSQPKKYE